MDYIRNEIIRDFEGVNEIHDVRIRIDTLENRQEALELRQASIENRVEDIGTRQNIASEETASLYAELRTIQRKYKWDCIKKWVFYIAVLLITTLSLLFIQRVFGL